MLVLALDTTSAHGSLALLDGMALRAVMGFRTAQPRHAEGLLPFVDQITTQVGATLKDIQGFAVAVGPGSFTGLRIGIAATEGLAYTLDRPVVGVSTLDATAYRYRHRRGLLVAMIEAYRSEVYGASYVSDGMSLVMASEPVCMGAGSFMESVMDSGPAPVELVAGSGVDRYRSMIEERVTGLTTLAEPSLFIAEEIARLGAGMLDAGERAPLGGLDALYIRSSDAERNLAKATAAESERDGK